MLFAADLLVVTINLQVADISDTVTIGLFDVQLEKLRAKGKSNNVCG